jgi:hypothetical protein
MTYGNSSGQVLIGKDFEHTQERTLMADYKRYSTLSTLTAEI